MFPSTEQIVWFKGAHGPKEKDSGLQYTAKGGPNSRGKRGLKNGGIEKGVFQPGKGVESLGKREGRGPRKWGTLLIFSPENTKKSGGFYVHPEGNVLFSACS